MMIVSKLPYNQALSVYENEQVDFLFEVTRVGSIDCSMRRGRKDRKGSAGAPTLD